MRYERFVDEVLDELTDEFEEFDEFRQYDAVDAADLYDEEEALDEAYDPFVFGPDDRFHVCRRGCTRSPTQFPFNTVCQVNYAGGFGSGALIAPQVVLSAKHVLTSGGTFACGPLGGT